MDFPYDNIRVFIPQEEISLRVAALAAEITRDYSGQRIIMVGSLKGAVVFMADLARQIACDVEFEFIHISSYGNSSVSEGQIRLDKDVGMDLSGRHVLIVEDIADSGHSLAFLRDHLSFMQPATLKVCALLDKPDRRRVEGLILDYIGFSIPDRFVVGYGLDYAQRYRNLPYIGILETANI